jgi:hypothetical protein
VSVETVDSSKLLRAKLALKHRGRLLHVRELPSKSLGVRVILAHMLFQLLLRAPSNIHSRAANFSAAEWFLVPIGVLQETSLIRKSLVEVVANMSGTFVPIIAVEVFRILLGRNLASC